MKAAAGRSHNFRHSLFNGHVNVFIGRTEDKLTVANFLSDLIQALADCFGVFLADNALTTEHSGVRLRALDIKGAVALFDHDSGIKIFH